MITVLPLKTCPCGIFFMQTDTNYVQKICNLQQSEQLHVMNENDIHDCRVAIIEKFKKYAFFNPNSIMSLPKSNQE